MVLGWFRGEREAPGVNDLIARGKYQKALEVLRQEFAGGRRDPALRMQLAEVLLMAGRPREALPVMLGLADEFARAGLAPKAISILKKVQAIDPRRDVAARLAALIRQNVPAPAAQDPNELTGEQLVALSGTELSLEPSERSEPTEAEGPESERPVKSPLFSDLEEHELQEVIQGLTLRTFDSGDIIVSAGESGDSLFVVASGTAKAFVPSERGWVLVRRMEEGDFFGEISILHGSVRTATVTAASRCDLLELDRATLDRISVLYPRVREVMQEFCEQRLESDARLRRQNS